MIGQLRFDLKPSTLVLLVFLTFASARQSVFVGPVIHTVASNNHRTICPTINNIMSTNRSHGESENSILHRAVVNEGKFPLTDGTMMEIKYSLPTMSYRKKLPGNKPLLLFIHGSFHSAWCWTSKFFPYFSSRGYPCVALSLRGTSGTFAGEGVKKVKVDDHVNDVLDFLQSLRTIAGGKDENLRRDSAASDTMGEINESCSSTIPPVVIAHSFGGLTAMKLLEHPILHDHTHLISSIGLLCSVPPSGIKKMSLRKLKKNPIDGWRIMKGLAMKKSVTNQMLCRRLFFDQAERDDEINDYMKHFQQDSKVTMDLVDMAKKLPILSTNDDGESLFIEKNIFCKPALVLGGSADFIVDRDAIEETAKFFAVRPVVVDGAVHDVMLAKSWETVAREVEYWLHDVIAQD
eukprot:CAMPEP_0171344530 /NCGR_PEP_ID=MMETSP0878-20121228/19577_1 /TAXON_ID=67004 /ORGANISM="Thalassiosira weissflogii, Strain CCMP1336" /LENGTH=404 /DNA_ID=CAMNT_0011847739 /DNA_START=21 /DNA_END=1235 /DNA_ORIENTATION=+